MKLAPYRLTLLLVALFSVACSQVAPASTPDLQATIDGAVATALAQIASPTPDLQATVDAAIPTATVPTLTATPTATATPIVNIEPTPTLKPSPTPTTTPPPTQGLPIFITGTGQQNTDPFTIPASPWTLEWEVIGAPSSGTTFVVHLANPRTMSPVAFNLVVERVSGPASGSTPIYDYSGTFHFDVRGPNEGWNITIVKAQLATPTPTARPTPTPTPDCGQENSDEYREARVGNGTYPISGSTSRTNWVDDTLGGANCFPIVPDGPLR